MLSRHLLIAIVLPLPLCIATTGCGLSASPTTDQAFTVPSGILRPVDSSHPAGARQLKYTVTTLAGDGKTGPLGGGYADGKALKSQFHDPMGVVADADGNLYVSDGVNHRIRVITAGGTVATVAGGGQPGPYGSLVDGSADSARFFGPE